jgi:predicted phage terminase large subunit-like protein
MIDMIRGKWEAPELLKRAKAFYSKHKKNCRYLKVEDAVSGTGLIQQLKGDMPVKGITRTKDKITRAYDVIPYIESGFLHLPDGADWLSDFVSEVTQFPNAAHDDQTDVLIDAISDMLVENRINWNDIL